jgi:hypothetical protein
MVGALGFNIGNNIEMKVKSKSDSTGVKNKIFESLNLSGSYNFAAKDHPWSILRSTGSLLSLIINLQLIQVFLDPYKIEFIPGQDQESEQKNSELSVYRDSMFRCLIL